MVAACIALWQLAEIVLLGFAAILLAILLRASAAFVARHTPVPERWAVGLTCLAFAAVLTGFVYVLGRQIRMQVGDLVRQLPQIIRSAEDWLGIEGLRSWIEERIQNLLDASSIAASVADYSTLLFAILANFLVVIAGGIYFALDPERYRNGTLKLVPPERRDAAGETFDTVGSALRLWMLGQLAAMLLVGVLTGLGLWLIGVPSPLALGLLAGLLEFIPFVGPIVAALPAVALALTLSPTTALWTAGLYLLIQQLEGNLIYPLIQQRAVDLPPPITIFALLSFGILLGPLGLILAAPLAVLSFVLVKKLWVRDLLDDEVDVPGD